MASLVTTRPRRAKGLKPRKASPVGDFFEEEALASVNPRRASSDSIRPAVFRSRRASSFAACKTSSSISKVVLTHLMIVHQCRGLNSEISDSCYQSSSRQTDGKEPK